MSTKTRFSLIAGIAAASLVLTACAIDDKSKAPDSNASGQAALSGELVVACGNQEDVCQAWTQAFQAKTGVKTSYVRLASGEAVARLEAGKSNPEFDVWHGGPVDGYNVAAEAGLLAKYDSPATKDIPKKYMDPAGYWGGVYVGVIGFCSNQKVLDSLGVQAPKKWEDLLNPKLHGQIMMAHPATSGTAFATLWTQVKVQGSDDKAIDWMKKLHNNVLQYTKSGSAPAQAAGRGEVAVSIVFSHDCIKYKEQGMSDLVATIPSDGTGWEIGGVALIAGAKNEAAAKAYYDWALSPEAEEIGPKHQSYQVLTNPHAKVDDRMVKLDQINLIDYDFPAAANAKSKLVDRFNEQIATAPKQ